MPSHQADVMTEDVLRAAGQERLLAQAASVQGSLDAKPRPTAPTTAPTAPITPSSCSAASTGSAAGRGHPRWRTCWPRQTVCRLPRRWSLPRARCTALSPTRAGCPSRIAVLRFGGPTRPTNPTVLTAVSLCAFAHSFPTHPPCEPRVAHLRFMHAEPCRCGQIEPSSWHGVPQRAFHGFCLAGLCWYTMSL